MKIKPLSLTLLVAALVPAAAAAAKPSGKGPCKEPTECKQGVCVEVDDDAYCSQTCGGCPAGMYCDANLFAVAGLKVCLKGTTSAPVKPEKPPRLPCKTDDMCPGALVCAQFMGHKDCALPCTQPAQCEAPEMMGIKMDFLACQLDEGTRGRQACLPKKSCLANPGSCMSVDSDKVAGTMKGLMGMAEGMAKGMEEAAGEPEPMEDPSASPGAAPAPAPATKGPAMSSSRFSKLLTQVKNAAFADDRATILGSAAKRNWFTCAQLGQIVDVIPFGDEKVGAVKRLAPRLVDLENSHTVLDKFTFGDDREAAARILDAQ